MLGAGTEDEDHRFVGRYGRWDSLSQAWLTVGRRRGGFGEFSASRHGGSGGWPRSFGAQATHLLFSQLKRKKIILKYEIMRLKMNHTNLRISKLYANAYM